MLALQCTWITWNVFSLENARKASLQADAHRPKIGKPKKPFFRVCGPADPEELLESIASGVNLSERVGSLLSDRSNSLKLWMALLGFLENFRESPSDCRIVDRQQLPSSFVNQQSWTANVRFAFDWIAGLQIPVALKNSASFNLAFSATPATQLSLAVQNSISSSKETERVHWDWNLKISRRLIQVVLCQKKSRNFEEP